MHKLIYIHGFNSAGNGDTAKRLQTLLADKVLVLSPTYPAFDPCASLVHLHEVIDRQACSTGRGDRVILAGTSLGGFWTSYFAKLFNLDAVLVNPALRPAEQLKKHLGINTNFSTNEQYELTPEHIQGYLMAELIHNRMPARSNIQAAVGELDDQVSPAEVRRYLGSAHNIHSFPNMGHRISEEYAPELARIIKTLL